MSGKIKSENIRCKKKLSQSGSSSFCFMKHGLKEKNRFNIFLSW